MTTKRAEQKVHRFKHLQSGRIRIMDPNCSKLGPKETEFCSLGSSQRIIIFSKNSTDQAKKKAIILKKRNIRIVY